MKATVVQIEGKYAVLLQEDGSFIKMKAMNLKIGDVVNKKATNICSICSKKKFGSIIAAALFAVLIGSGVYTYGAPSYYVSLDVNPGITMEVNRFERVIALEAANVEAEEVLEGLPLENKNIEEAISQIVERISDLGYFDEEGGKILIAVTAKNMENTEQAAGKLGDKVKVGIAEQDKFIDVTTKVLGFEMVEAAKQNEGMTPGRYNLIVNLLKVSPEDAADYSETSIRNIMKMVADSKGINGKKKSKDASENEQNIEGKVTVDKDFVEEDASESPTEANLQEKNAPIDTPASYRKASNAEAMENNSDKRSENSTNLDEPVSEKKIGAAEKPEIIEKPEIPVIDIRNERPETSPDPDPDPEPDPEPDTEEEEKEDTEEAGSVNQENPGDRIPEKPNTPAGERP